MANVRIVDHVERLRAKPEHIRMRLAMGTTFGVTGLVVVIWASSVLVSGKLAINPYGNLQNTASSTGTVTGVDSSQVAGVGAIFQPAAPATLKSVDVATTTPTDSPVDQTVDPTGGSQTVISF